MAGSTRHSQISLSSKARVVLNRHHKRLMLLGDLPNRSKAYMKWMIMWYRAEYLKVLQDLGSTERKHWMHTSRNSK